MAKVLLTAAAVKTLKPDAESWRAREIVDAGCRGLRLLIHPSGTKTWIMRLRRPDDRTGTLTLGRVNLFEEAIADSEVIIGATLTLTQARRLATEVHHQRAMGRDVFSDPRLHRKQSQQKQKSIADRWQALAEQGVEPLCFLYRHYDARGDLLYVGMTLHLIARQTRHIARAAWANRICRIEIEPFVSREELLEAEAAAIATEFPKFNRTHNERRHREVTLA